MESITKPAQVVQPPENSILHPVEAYLDRRAAQEPVHLVQYDTGIPVLTVALFQKDKPYAVPAGAAVNLRLSKPDGTCVYDPVLGLSQDRQTVYVQVSRQMTAAAGLANAILEILLNGGVVGTASFLLFLEANPVTDDAILSADEFKSLDDYVNQAETSAASAQEAAERAQTLRDAVETDYKSIEEAKKEVLDNAEAAGKSAAQSKAQADRAKEYADTIQVDYDYIEKARTDAQASATAAKASETAAKNSQTAAAGSASAAKTAQEQAAASAAAAKASQDAAEASQTAAEQSKDAAKASQTAAEKAKTAAAGSASAAASSATAAAASAKNVEDMSNLAESYAVGGTDTRPNEDADNAKYYYEQAKGISQGLAGALLPMGTVRFAELSSQTKEPGYMYNISDAFTTDGTFNEGPGHAYPAGTNVYYTAEGKWDCLAGTQVVSVAGRTGAVTLTKADVGLDQVDNTPDSKKNVASAATATKLAAAKKINGVEFDGSKDITVADSTKLPLTGGTVTGTLILSKTTDASGTANSSPALIVGGAVTAQHLELDSNEVMAKKNATATDTLYLNNEGGLVKVGSGGLQIDGDLTMSGATRKIMYNSGTRTGSIITFYAGDKNGSGLVIGDGGRTIIGAGEAAQNLRGALGDDDEAEDLHLANDQGIYLHTNCQTIGSRHTFSFLKDGRIGNVIDPVDVRDVANKQYVDKNTIPMRTINVTADMDKDTMLNEIIQDMVDSNRRVQYIEFINNAGPSYSYFRDGRAFVIAYVANVNYAIFMEFQYDPSGGKLRMVSKYGGPVYVKDL